MMLKIRQRILPQISSRFVVILFFFTMAVSFSNVSDGEDTSLATKVHYYRANKAFYIRNLCIKLADNNGAPLSKTAAEEALILTQKKYPRERSVAAGLDPFEPIFLRADSSTVAYSLKGINNVESCTAKNSIPPPQFSDPCTMANSQTQFFEDTLSAIDHKIDVNRLMAINIGCPPHLKVESLPKMGCFNPCPENTPLYVGEKYDSDDGQSGKRVPKCEVCPVEFPVWSHEKLDCVDLSDCTRTKGHHQLPSGDMACGRGCPMGWKVTKDGGCKEDPGTFCQICDKAIDELASWQNPFEASKPEEESPCALEELARAFENYKTKAIQDVVEAQRKCLSESRSDSAIPAGKFWSADFAKNQCYSTIQEVGNVRSAEAFLRSQLTCKFRQSHSSVFSTPLAHEASMYLSYTY